jgi:hypothetical protein
MREGGFENAKALSEAAGFSNYHNYHPYADFDNWLNNDQAVVITLNQEDARSMPSTGQAEPRVETWRPPPILSSKGILRR